MPVLAAAHKPFDFTAAERFADTLLNRKPAPADPNPVIPPPKPQPPACAMCKDTFAAPCPNHKTQAPFIADGQTEAERCPLCKGLGWLPCPQCKKKKEALAPLEVVEARFKAELENAQALLKDVHELEAADKLNTRLTGYIAPHFSIATTLDKKLLGPCINHCESLLVKLSGEFHSEKFSFTLPADTRFDLLNTQAEYKRFLEKITKAEKPDLDLELAGKGAGYHTSLSLPSTAFSCFEKIGRNAQLLQHTCVHWLGHFLLDRVADSRVYPSWLEEGFAAYSETLEMSSPCVYCFAYVQNQADILKNRDQTLRRMASQNKPLPMEGLTRMTLMDMKAEEYFQAWSLTTMLIERDPEKFVAFLKALPSGTQDPGGLRIEAAEQEKALQEAYGYDFPKLLAVWRQWVLAQ